MSEHYYTRTPTSQHDMRSFEIALDGLRLSFQTDAGVFSRDGLDSGTELLIRTLPALKGEVLDMGCGWGALSLFVKARNPLIRLTAVDINERAVQLARANAELNGIACEVIASDGFEALGGRSFDSIISNPPIRAGKRVIYAMFDRARGHLPSGGALYIVMQTKQGADSALKYLKGIYASAEVIGRGGGFKVIKACVR